MVHPMGNGTNGAAADPHAAASGNWTRPAGYRPASRVGAMPTGQDPAGMPAQQAAAPPPASGPVGRGSIEHLLAALVQYGGSDLLLVVGTPPRLRIDGVLRELQREPLSAEEISVYVRELLDDERVAVLQHYRSVDFAFTGAGGSRFRGNVYYSRSAFSVAVRYLPGVIPEPETLGIPESVINLTRASHGLVLVTGPTGSGKSTTIASLIERINQTRPCHIVTIEDPIEFRFRHAAAAIDQREIGWDALTFADALRSVLREDPDVVLVGEMRDLDSTQSTITVAETGHLVFATLHTNDAPQAIDRIVDVFPPQQQEQVRTQIASCLLAVVHQRLVPVAGGGRVAAFEVMLASDGVRKLIREGRANQLKNMMAQGVREGMMTLEQSLARLGVAGPDPEVVDVRTAGPQQIAPVAPVGPPSLGYQVPGPTPPPEPTRL